MNTSSAPYDPQQRQQQHQHQQQGQQQQGYGNRQLSSSALLSRKPAPYGAPHLAPASASTSSINLNAAVGRPLPRTPASQQQQHHQQQLFPYQDSAAPSGVSPATGGHASSSYQNLGSDAITSSVPHNGAGGFLNDKSSAMSARSSRVSIHTSQQPATSIASTSSVHSSMGIGPGAKTGHSSWLQPKTASSASTSLSTFPSSLPSGAVAAGPTISTSSTPLGRRMSQPPLYQQQQQASPTAHHESTEDASGYYAALTRPISPTMVMSYIPPPANNANQTSSNSEALGHSTAPSPATSSTHHSSLRPMSATTALSSSFNTFSSGSQSVQKPATPQGARSSYIGPSTTYVSGNSSTTPGNVASTQSKTSFSPMSSESPASSSSRFARRGPLVMNQDNSSFAEGVDAAMNSSEAKSRRQSAAYSDVESPAQNQYIQSVQGQQPFSPASQRTDVGGNLMPGAAGMQLQIAKEGWLWRRGNLLTWKRCYAMGRYRGDAHPGIFTLFKDNEHLFPIKTIDMSECFEVQVKAQDAKGTGRFEFKVVTRKEETWFATDTMSERTGWIDALNSLMAKVVGASLMKLEQKLNNIRHRNHSLEYAHTSLPAEKASMEGHLQLVQQDLVAREQQLSQRELDLEKKRVEALLVQLEAWRSAAKVTVNQHYSVRDQLLERVMKAARTFQELQERAKIHLETGSDQVIEVVNSHLDCLKVHASETSMSPASFRMLKSILVGLTVNLDTRSSEIKRVLLVMEQYISAIKTAAAPRTSSLSSPSSPVLAGSYTSTRERRISVAEPPSHTKTPSPTPTVVGMSVYLVQIKEKYTTTLEILEEHSKQMKRVLERADIQSADNVRKFHEEAREVLKSLLNLPSYAFTPCIPDQPLPGAPDTFYREDLVQLQQQSQEILRRGQSLNGQPASTQSAQVPDKSQDAASRDNGVSRTNTSPRTPEDLETPTTACEMVVKPQPRATASSLSSGPPTLPLTLPPSLSSFLLPDKDTVGASTADLTQRLRDTILPEFDHLSIKHEESTQSMMLLLNQISSQLVNKLTEIKDATASQRQEFEELKDEIIDVMQLSATDPSAPQRDISTLSEIRSKLAEITEQLTKVQSAQSQAAGATYLGSGSGVGSGSYRRVGPPLRSSGASMGESAATATGFSLLQRSASTLGHSSHSGGAHPFYHTIDSNPRQHLQRVNSTSLQSRLHIPTSASLAAGIGAGGLASMANSGQGRHPKIAGMAQKFEEGDMVNTHLGLAGHTDRRQQDSLTNMPAAFLLDKDTIHHDHLLHGQMQVVSKLDQLLLLLEFVNTAQCRMMAYQDLEFDRGLKGGYGTSNVDDGRMMAVQEHMEQLDRKMSLQMHLLRQLVTLQASDPLLDTERVLTKTQGMDDADGARLQELSDDDGLEDSALGNKMEKGETSATKSASSSSPSPATLGEVEMMVRELPSERELSFIEVLDRLDLQVIPSVKDQSSRIQELSDQLSEMKRQLDEQQRRQADQQLRSGGTLRTRVSSPSSADRSRSSERPVTPLLHSRSPSQPLGLSSNSANPLQSPLETETPAFWRASLRPSASNGSNYSGSVRERTGAQSTNSLPQATTAFSQGSHGSVSNAQEATAAAFAGSQASGSWNHSLQHQTSFGSSSSLITKTSDRIAEMLERMDARMSQVIDEQLARYEKGNKELLAKVYDLLDADEDENEDDDQEGHVGEQAKHRTRQNSSPLTGASVSHLLTDTNASSSTGELQSEQYQTADVKQMLEKILRVQDDLLRTSLNSDPTGRRQHAAVKSSEDDDRQEEQASGEALEESTPSESLSIAVSESLDKIKTLIQQEGDRSEATLNEQRDEVLEKMHQLLSAIQESRADQSERGASLKEELQEMREWIVKHSSLQTENLREIVLAAATSGSKKDGAVLSLKRGEANDFGGEADGVLVGHGGSTNGLGSSGSDEEEYAAVDISEDLDLDHRANRPHRTNSAIISSSSEIRELREQLEMFTKIQMATFSELADNVSGVERMMRDMSKVVGVRRGGTILRKKEADQDRAMLAMEVKETIEEVMARMGPTATTATQQQPQQLRRWSTGIGMGQSSIDGDHISSSESNSTASNSGLFKYLYQPRRSVSMVPTSTAAASTISDTRLDGLSDIIVDTTNAPADSPQTSPQSPTGSEISNNRDNLGDNMSHVQATSTQDAKLQMQLQLESYQDQIEQLYKRKARAEIEVEDLQTEKHRLREEVEQLRKEKQELLLLETKLVARTPDAPTTLLDGASEADAGMLLEKMLQSRMAMLLQETAHLEARKIRLAEEP